MKSMLKSMHPWGRRGSRPAGACSLAVAILLGLGCPGTPTDSGSGGSDGESPTSGGDATTVVASAQIVGLSLGRTLSERDPPISVKYSVTGAPDSISGFYVPVVDTNPNSPPIPDEPVVSLEQNLLMQGEDLRFDFDPGASGVGFFRVGLLVTVGDEVTESLSVGVINVQGLPDPIFVQPSELSTDVPQGGTQTITFDIRAPLGVVQWRLFYLTAGDSGNDRADVLGTEIAFGTGNIGTATFSTVGLAPGVYTLGVSATDTGRSVVDEAIAGDLGRIVTVFGPEIRVTTETVPTP